MVGYRKADIEFTNQLFFGSVEVDFIKVNKEEITELYFLLKKLVETVSEFYEFDELLVRETDEFVMLCKRSMGIIENYKDFFMDFDVLIRKYFTITKRTIYSEIFNHSIKPIIESIKTLRIQGSNAYIEKITELLSEFEKSVIVTKQKSKISQLNIRGTDVIILSEKELVNSGVFYDQVFYIGTPSYFSGVCSEVFYAKKTLFLGYSFYQNLIVKSKLNLNFVGKNELVNTVYNDILIGSGYSGEENTNLLIKKEGISEETIISSVTITKTTDTHRGVEAKLATLSNNRYVFLPIRQKLNIINRDSLSINQMKVKDITPGDLLIFRSQNGSELIREVADSIIGERADDYRKLIHKWKKRLRHNVDKIGISKVSKILIHRFGILKGTENNIKNWLDKFTIKPSCLEELLVALKFKDDEVNDIMNACKIVVSAHISAGHEISQLLMKKIDDSLESIIEEIGYYEFTAPDLRGASFNIEEIKRISSQVYIVSENNVLKTIKNKEVI